MHFTFDLWHYPSYINTKSGINTINDQLLNRLSWILKRPGYAKKQIGKDFRTGWGFIMFIVFVFFLIMSIITTLAKLTIISSPESFYVFLLTGKCTCNLNGIIHFSGIK